VVHHLPGDDRVNWITILPRGDTLGVTQFVAGEDHYNYSREMLMARLAVGLGGRVAEELALDADGQPVMNGGDQFAGQNWFASADAAAGTAGESPSMAALADLEVQRLLREAYHTARNVLSEHDDQLSRRHRHLWSMSNWTAPRSSGSSGSNTLTAVVTR